MIKNFSADTQSYAGEITVSRNFILPAMPTLQGVQGEQIKKSDRTEITYSRGLDCDERTSQQQASGKPPSRSQLRRHRKQRRRQGHPERLVLIAAPSGLILATASELGLKGGES